MRILEINYKKPTNLLIASLQDHCRLLMSDPQANGISNLEEFGEKLWKFAETQQNLFPRCKLSDIDVILDRTAVREWYNLLYKDDKSMITISARPGNTEKCFRYYDTLSKSEKRTDFEKLLRFLNCQRLNEVDYKSKHPVSPEANNFTSPLRLQWRSYNF